MKYLGGKSIASAIYSVLNIIWYAVIVGTIIVTIFAAAIAAGFLGDPDSLELKMSGLRVAFSPEVLQSHRWLALPIFSVLPAMGAMAFIIGQLRSVFGTLIDRNPFAPENPGRIRNIGFAMFVLAAVKSAATMLFNAGLVRNLRIPGAKLHADFTVDVTTILAGVVILVLSEVFRIGFALKEEHDLTV